MPKPSSYTQEIADEIVARLWKGETLAAICKSDGMPGRRTVSDWRAAHPDFAKAYDEAMLGGCHALLDETIAIADDAAGDFVETDKGPAYNPEHVQRSKLRIWARHELIKRKRPDVFSDKVDLNHGGNVGFSLRVHRRRSGQETAE